MDPETRAYLDEMRSELRGEIGQLRGEVGASATTLRAEMADLRTELRGDLGELRLEMAASHAETRRHFDVTAEALRHEIATVAEGVVVNAAAIDRLRDEFHGEMDRRFVLVQVGFDALRRDIADLRASR